MQRLVDARQRSELKTALFLLNDEALNESSNIRSKFVERLCELLEFKNGEYKAWSDLTLFKALESLKIVGRNPAGCAALFSSEGVKNLVLHCNLSAFIDSDTAIEALKCLSNCLLLDLKLCSILHEDNIDISLVVALKAAQSDMAKLLLVRILFLLSLRNYTFSSILVGEFHVDHYIFNIFKEYVGGNSNHSESLMSEILKLMYNLTAEFNTLMNTTSTRKEDEYKRSLAMSPFKNWIPLVVRFINNLPGSQTPLSSPYSTAINVLLTFPLSNPEWRASLWFADSNYMIVTKLLHMLDTIILQAFPTPEVDDYVLPTDKVCIDEAVTPLMILLNNIAMWDTQALEIIKSIITPADLHRNIALDKGDSLASRMIAFMSCTTQPNLKALGSELIFKCCNENGYGHAAGFMFERGIQPSGISSSSQGIFDPISGRGDAVKPVTEAEMTDEEKECEAEKLFYLLDRLNKQGVIKPVFK